MASQRYSWKLLYLSQINHDIKTKQHRIWLLRKHVCELASFMFMYTEICSSRARLCLVGTALHWRQCRPACLRDSLVHSQACKLLLAFKGNATASSWMAGTWGGRQLCQLPDPFHGAECPAKGEIRDTSLCSWVHGLKFCLTIWVHFCPTPHPCMRTWQKTGPRESS